MNIPLHLRKFAYNQAPQWTKNALSAIFQQQKDQHYTISDGKIIPIDCDNTGVLQQSMVWSDGMTQFLQIKEGLRVTPESISTNYLSSISYFKRYGNNLFGLTGTLGDKTTRQFF